MPVAAEELLHLLEALAVLEDELQVLRLDIRRDEVAQQQLASILTVGLNDAGTVQGAFKLIDSFGALA